ncbi:MAG: hypothetical protein IT324_05900 [Anaerolineae bacterium]|nr:hypothetical protein [Anaerolineae bacterium]
MQRVTAPDISSAEWRWVIIFSGLLVAITLLPYAWAFAVDSPRDNWQFMGILPNPQDGASYLSKIREGARGDWLYTMAYTPEPHNGAALHEFYILLGHLSRPLDLSPLLLFHIARLVTGFVMYLSIYHLGAVIWPRVRPRRLFFALVGIGSGLGWLGLLFLARPTGATDATWLPTDLWIYESIPFVATFANPHFPLAIALIALLASTFVIVFRPGFSTEPTMSNGGLSVILITIALCLVQPQGWPPIAAALLVYIGVLIWRTRHIPRLELNWVLLVILPALPIFIYYVAVVRENAALRIWNEQNQTPSPAPLLYVFGFGLLLLVGIPGIWRAVRRFERDGDRFMLIWLIVNVIGLYAGVPFRLLNLTVPAPFNLERRLAIGLIIPIVYFAVRALEDYWLHRISPKWRYPALIAVIVFVLPSNVLSLGIPLVGVLKPESGIESYQVLPIDYLHAIQWLNDHATRERVVLAAPRPSLWIPAYSDMRVVYGHPYETIYADRKLKEVTAWYKGEDCTELLTRYQVNYVLNDTLPNGANSPCVKNLGEPVAVFDNVAVYAIP